MHNPPPKKIGALIPVRLSSERLPGKALMKIHSKPVIGYLLDRVFACKYIKPQNVIVCTTEDPADAPLIAEVENYGAKIYRGARDDIIRRFHDTIEFHGFDAVIQVDGDDPLSATEYMDLTMDRLLSDPELDIVTCERLPLGTGVKSFTRKAMQKVFTHYKTTQNDTGFIYFFTKSGLCRQAVVEPISPSHVHKKARLTLDYQADFEVFSKIFEALEGDGNTACHDAVVAYLNAHPELVEHNCHVEQEYWQRTIDKAGDMEFIDETGNTRQLKL